MRSQAAPPSAIEHNGAGCPPGHLRQLPAARGPPQRQLFPTGPAGGTRSPQAAPSARGKQALGPSLCTWGRMIGLHALGCHAIQMLLSRGARRVTSQAVPCHGPSVLAVLRSRDFAASKATPHSLSYQALVTSCRHPRAQLRLGCCSEQNATPSPTFHL